MPIHEDDFGILPSRLGKNANSPKGRANASEKPSIPISGFRKLPFAAPRATAPAIGSVQENDTKTSVSAIKNTPT